MKIILRELCLDDLDSYRLWNLPDKRHHDFNGPYFGRDTVEELDERIKKMRTRLNDGKSARDNMLAIVNEDTDELIGTVSKYFKSIETDWLEVGIAIFNENYWSKGIGYQALKQWIDLVFNMHPTFVRLGLTTWSGNIGMMKLSEKLGLKQEACYRKARIVNGQYYDSVSYGILREEWFDEDNK
ncbi:GNAT family N-acetyltransferase [Acidaminobacter sp. JC074]|uniref:GNAT family N-acetyltransferase n=1 Tax=Acidaminobacter sp. JC074 TaxID=2530199 RepID=UPI001F0EBE42|nr:GNAT family protein [Acidaminobacter sp. JC074]MCH4891358.1 GNAT family N-acetyltransferase [Acidaminobacter sp. JC074]